jgi:hypothetical protein
MKSLGLVIIFIIVFLISWATYRKYSEVPQKDQLHVFLDLYMKYMASKLSLSSEDKEQIKRGIFDYFNREAEDMSLNYGYIEPTQTKNIDENRLADCLNTRVALFTTFYVPKKKCPNVFDLINLIKNSVENEYDKTSGGYLDIVKSFTPIIAENCEKVDDKK